MQLVIRAVHTSSNIKIVYSRFRFFSVLRSEIETRPGPYLAGRGRMEGSYRRSEAGLNYIPKILRITILLEKCLYKKLRNSIMKCDTRLYDSLHSLIFTTD